MSYILTNRSNHSFQAFLLTVLLFLIGYLSIGWWTDSYQYTFDTGLTGDATDYLKPYKDSLPEYMPGGTWLFTNLSKFYPIRWVSIFLNGILFVSLWVLYFHILKHTENAHVINRALIILFFSILFFESVVLYHMVRITMFAGIAGLSGVLLNNVEEDNKKWLTKSNILYLLLFAIAMWIRCSVHLFVILFVSLAFIVHGKSLKPLMPFHIVFSLFFLYYIKTVFLTDYSDDMYYNFVYNLEFKLQHTGDYKPTLLLNDALDSLKYNAVKLDFLGDEKNLNLSFFERTGAVTNHSIISVHQFFYAVATFINSMKQNIYFLIADIILIISYLFFGGNEIKNYKSKTIVLFLLFYLMLLGISFIKMQNRFMVPFQTLFLLIMVLIHRPLLFYKKSLIPVFSLFLICYIPVVWFYTKQKIDIAIKQHQNFEKTFDWISHNFKDHKVVINTVIMFTRKPYKSFEYTNRIKELHYYNAGSRHLSPIGRAYIERKCDCNAGDFYSFYDYLSKSAPEVVVIDHPIRIRMLEKYLRDVNNSPHTFERINVPDDIQKAMFSQGYRDSLSLFRMIN